MSDKLPLDYIGNAIGAVKEEVLTWCNEVLLHIWHDPRWQSYIIIFGSLVVFDCLFFHHSGKPESR
jgi:hypothetical protein